MTFIAPNSVVSTDATPENGVKLVPEKTRIVENQLNGNHVVTEEYSYPKEVINQPRPIRIIIIGAGIAGIAAVKLFKERFTGLPVSLTIYEKNADVGGTWLENRYPG